MSHASSLPRAKRLMDLAVAIPVSGVSAPLCLILILLSSFDTRAFGLFTQERIGRHGKTILVRKIRTMRPDTDDSTVTVADDRRVTRFGGLLRKWKLDELPQFWNVAMGEMSLVGPRPDVPGYADMLQGEDRDLLELRPGITGAASLIFRNEADVLTSFDDPRSANDQIIWPAKVAINRLYQKSGRLRDEVAILDMTLRGNDRRLCEMLERWDPTIFDRHPVVDAIMRPEGQP